MQVASLGGIVSALFWIFFIFLAFMPAYQRRMLAASRLRLLHQLERRRGTRAITLIHRQETMSFLGFPLLKYIDITDSEEILRAVRLTPEEMPIDLILHTPGGLVLAAEQIARALKRHSAKVTVFVPHYAMSGGTMLALAADEIVMDENAVLGPVDPQLGEYPAASLLRVVEEKEAKDLEDKTLILADSARKALAQVQQFVREILAGKVDEEKATEITQALTEGHWTHDYPITLEIVRELGLPVSTGLPAEIYRLMELYPQAAQRRPSVQYIPLPYSRPQRPAQK
jgi:ClpP class serine protease